MPEHLQRDRERDETAAVVSRGGGRTPDETAQELAWWSRVAVAGGATSLRWLDARRDGGGGRRLAWWSRVVGSPEDVERRRNSVAGICREKWQLRARGRRGSVFEP